MTYAAYSFLQMIKRQLIRPLTQSKNHVFEKYGKEGCWAVVTGGSDGIGLAMCHNLAAQGFNICIVARNPSKMEGCRQEIEKRTKVKTMQVVADFGQMRTMEAYN